jgi:hypothetical protein
MGIKTCTRYSTIGEPIVALNLTSSPICPAEIQPQDPAAVVTAGAGVGEIWYVKFAMLYRLQYWTTSLVTSCSYSQTRMRLRCLAHPPLLPPFTTQLSLEGPLWFLRQPFQMRIHQLVSFASPTGTVRKADLELANAIAHKDVLVQTLDTR